MAKRKTPIHNLRYLLNRRLLIILLVLGQILFSVLLILEYSKLHWLSDLLQLISVITALHLLTRPGKAAVKISLIFFILLFPVFGGALYWIFFSQTTTSVGFRKRINRIAKTRHSDYHHRNASLADIEPHLPENQNLLRYLSNLPDFPVYGNTESRYFPTGGEMLEAMLEDIRNAKRYVFLEYFIIAEGELWGTILDLLCQKVKEGVDVRVIYDDFGCFLSLPPKYERKLRQHGIKCYVFNKVHPFLSTSHNNRDHRKILVVDGEIAYTGGINLADEYINKKIKYGHWKDNAIRLKGDGAWSFTVMFLHMWSFLSKTEEDVEKFHPVTKAPACADGWIHPYTDSPMDAENVGEHVYLQIIQSARKYLYITTPYLMVDDGMISALKLSAKSGVDVRIITPEIPDKKAVHFTTRSYYRELVHAGVKIYEYAGGFIHCKSFVCDDRTATVGTANLDFRSLYFHFECGTCLYRTSSVLDVKKDFLDTMEKSRPILEADCKANLVVKLFQDIFRLFAPLM